MNKLPKMPWGIRLSLAGKILTGQFNMVKQYQHPAAGISETTLRDRRFNWGDND